MNFDVFKPAVIHGSNETLRKMDSQLHFEVCYDVYKAVLLLELTLYSGESCPLIWQMLTLMS